jgi:cytochrome P450
MRRQEVALSVIRALVKHPGMADALFRFDRWGNILGPDRFVDPYPIYERMRGAGPVSFSPFIQQWAVVGYDEARQVLSSSSFGVSAQVDLVLGARPYSTMSEATKALLRNALLFTDPPVHTRRRSAVSRAFTPRQVRRLEPRVRQLVDRHLADITDDPEPDLVTRLAEPLAIQVIAELIGVPEERWPWMAARSTTLRQVADPFVVLDPAAVDATCDELAIYYSDLADQRLADPRDDLITELARAEADDGQIDRAELISLIVIFMLAGHETTTGAIGNAVLALARHPDQRDLVRRSPDLWPNAIEELLRFDTVLQTDPRTALETTTIAGRTIKKGQNVTVMLGAANRDPRRFDDADQLRLDREDPAPLSFGHGLHHCIGAALARLELRTALPAVVEALGDYTVDDVSWKTSLAFRSPTRLRVRRPPQWNRHRPDHDEMRHEPA